MKILLDTHILLWWFANDPTLSGEARKTIANIENAIFISAASAWEISTKKTLGKLKAPDDIEAAVNLNRFEMLPITIRHALEVSNLPPHHADPFDRLLFSQAKIENLTLITHDKQLSKYDISILYT